MIKHFYNEKEGGMLEVREKRDAGVWTHVIAPTPQELATLAEDFGLESLIIADIKDIFEVPRYEQEGSISYFFTRFLNDDEDSDVDTLPLLIILGPSFIVTIANQDALFLKSFITGKRSVITTQETVMFLEIMTAMMTNYARALNTLRKAVQRDVARVRNIRGKDIQRLVYFEQELNEILSALLPTNMWLQQLEKGNYIKMFSDDRERLEDLLIASSQIVDSVKMVIKTIQNIRSASEAILTYRLNNTMRMLTAFTIILTIPTIIASLFGMNVPIPMQDYKYGFWIVLGIIIIVIGITIHFFVRNRWI